MPRDGNSARGVRQRVRGMGQGPGCMPWSMAQGEEIAGFAGAAWDGGALTLTSLFRRLSREADGAAVSVASRLAVDGHGDREAAGRAAVEITALVGHAWGDAQRAEQRVIKLLRGLKISLTKHHMTEHCFLRGVPVVANWDREMVMDGWRRAHGHLCVGGIGLGNLKQKGHVSVAFKKQNYQLNLRALCNTCSMIWLV